LRVVAGVILKRPHGDHARAIGRRRPPAARDEERGGDDDRGKHGGDRHVFPPALRRHCRHDLARSRRVREHLCPERRFERAGAVESLRRIRRQRPLDGLDETCWQIRTHVTKMETFVALVRRAHLVH
jgi:hypothetical protein